MLRQDCSTEVGKATAEHSLGRAWEDRRQWISPARLRAAGVAWNPLQQPPGCGSPKPTCRRACSDINSHHPRQRRASAAGFALPEWGCLGALRAIKDLACVGGTGLMSPVPREGERMGCHPSPRRGHFITGTPLSTQPRPRALPGISAPTDTSRFHHCEQKNSLLCNFKGHSVHLSAADCSMVNCSLS